MALTKVSSKTLSDNAVTSDKIATGAISVSDISDNSITVNKLHTQVQGALGTRNLIINGDMRIAQRGTSVSGKVTGGYDTVDRFRYINSGETITEEQSTDVPTGQGFYNSFKATITTANTPTGTQQTHISTKLEGQNFQHLKFGTSSAENLTVSFWIKTNFTDQITLWLWNQDANRQIAYALNVDSANTWQKVTWSIDGDTAGAINNDNGTGLQLRWVLASGDSFQGGTLDTSWAAIKTAGRYQGQGNFTGTTSNYINITGVQLEVGTEATPFEHRPYDMELQRCMRYFERTPNYGTALASASYTGVEWTDIPRDKPVNYAIKDVRFQVRKRAAATINFSSLNGTAGQMSNVYSGVDIGNTNAIWGGERGFTFRNGTGGTISASSHNGIAVSWEASAEL